MVLLIQQRQVTHVFSGVTNPTKVRPLFSVAMKPEEQGQVCMFITVNNSVKLGKKYFNSATHSAKEDNMCSVVWGLQKNKIRCVLWYDLSSRTRLGGEFSLYIHHLICPYSRFAQLSVTLKWDAYWFHLSF